jgi:PTH1 family peptidyl-tRNA hydrolase
MSVSHAPQVWLAVGLGNPGTRYGGTRHNAGSRAVERLAKKLGVRLKSNRAPALAGDAHIDGVRLVLACPSTYMNESGRAVAALVRQKGIDPEHLIVVHDEIDLPAGSLRIKFGGGSAGHHGVDSVVNALGTRDFYRVRIGVGRSAHPSQEPSDFVLEPISRNDAPVLVDVEARAAEAVLSLINDGLQTTMNRYNSPAGTAQ